MLDAQMIGQMASQALSGMNPVLGGGDQLWAVDARRLEGGVTLARSMRDARSAAGQSRRGAPYGNGSLMRRSGSTAIIPIYGPLTARGNWAYCSYDEIIRDIRTARDDTTIDSILYDVDSPGGMVSNVEAAAREIAAAAAEKPSIAHVGGLGASAAYWLSAAAGQVIAAETSLVGSVGCLIRYMDIEGIFTKLGGKVVEVIADQSPNKRLDPATPEGKAELLAIANDGAEMFLAGLEASRGVSRETLMENYGQGLVFTAREALSRGLIDGIGSFEETLAALADRRENLNGAASATVQNGQETIMADNKTDGQPKAAEPKTPVTVDSLRAEHGDLIAQIEAAAADRGATAERERILGIEASSMPGCEDLVAGLKADGKTTPAEAAVQILARVKQSGSAASAVLEKMDKAAEGVVSTPSGSEAPASVTSKPKASTPEEWTAEWGASEKLQAEYPTAESYVATMKREQGK